MLDCSIRMVLCCSALTISDCEAAQSGVTTRLLTDPDVQISRIPAYRPPAYGYPGYAQPSYGYPGYSGFPGYSGPPGYGYPGYSGQPAYRGYGYQTRPPYPPYSGFGYGYPVAGYSGDRPSEDWSPGARALPRR
jgi:hypothetical protein